MSKHPLSRFFNPPFPALWSHFPFNNWSLFDEDFLPEDMSLKGVRVYEEDQKLHIEVPLPGLSAEDIEVSLNQGVLWIKGESKEEETSKTKKIYRSSKRQYSYSLALPTQIDEKEQPQATYTDGILKVSLRIAKPSETKKIPIKSGKSRKE